MVKGLVSVIICCFNGKEFIASCFNSLLAQTYKRLEIIFIDDGSTDGSYDLALGYSEQLLKEGMNLLCLKQSNQGVGFACANGLSLANGEYICVFDVDDYLYPESLQKRVQFLDAHSDYAVVRTNGYKFSQNGQKHLFVSDNQEIHKEDIFEDLLLGRTNNWPGSYLVRANALWNVFPDRSIPGSRYGQNLQILLSASWNNKAGFINEPLMEYRFNPRSFTNQDTNFEASFKRFLGFWLIRLTILSKLGITSSDLLNKLKVTYGKILMDLCLSHSNREKYMAVYRSIVPVQPLEPLYKYHYYRFSGKMLTALVFRGINYLQSHSKR